MFSYIHKPVLVAEVLEFLTCLKGRIFVDATIGEGGHAEEVLKCLSPEKLIGIDQDREILEISKRRFKGYKNAVFVCENFVDLEQILKELRIDKIDGIVFDLGVSLYHFKISSRGFSFRKTGPLDMRMNSRISLTAGDIVNRYPYEKLREILRDYGEEYAAGRIARAIVKRRAKHIFKTTVELADFIAKVKPYRGRIHPATKTFQALRIEVNKELDVLKEALVSAVNCLKEAGRICVISYHSLEDRIVKHTMRECEKEGISKTLTTKVVKPNRSEVLGNPSARSAKLRVAERR
jgi:16S rRNA (cytosine1402-N4)-methyltransferase